jgi:hypothetical protein
LERGTSGAGGCGVNVETPCGERSEPLGLKSVIIEKIITITLKLSKLRNRFTFAIDHFEVAFIMGNRN